MRVLTASAVVDTDRKLTLAVPGDVPIGIHQVVVVFDTPNGTRPAAANDWLLPNHNTGPWPAGFEVRREVIYGDDGR